jgi:rubredoxin
MACSMAPAAHSQHVSGPSTAKNKSLQSSSLFQPLPSLRGAVRRAQGHRRQQVVVQALFKGSAKRTSTPYLCIDCGYIYDGREPFSSLPNSYRCPVCQAPKRRFKVYQKPVSSNNGARPVKQQKPDGRLDDGECAGVRAGALVDSRQTLYQNSLHQQ